MNIQMVGLFAGLLTTAAWIPQLARTWRGGSTEDLSWPYLLVFATGVSTWIFYGVLTGDPPVLIANVVSIMLIASLVELKRRAHFRALSDARVGIAGVPTHPVPAGEDAASSSLKPGPATQQAIIDAVISLSLEHPGVEPGVDAVAERSGVATSTVESEFHDGLGLLHAVAARLHAETAERA